MIVAHLGMGLGSPCSQGRSIEMSSRTYTGYGSLSILMCQLLIYFAREGGGLTLDGTDETLCTGIQQVSILLLSLTLCVCLRLRTGSVLRRSMTTPDQTSHLDELMCCSAGTFWIKDDPARMSIPFDSVERFPT